MRGLESGQFGIHGGIYLITSFNTCLINIGDNNTYYSIIKFLPFILVSWILSYLGNSGKEIILTSLVSWVEGLNDMYVLYIKCQH